MGYEHVRSTGIFHVAELEGRIVAIAGAILRDHLWYLSAFWARPGLQRRGIGMPLLRRVWNAGQQAGARHRLGAWRVIYRGGPGSTKKRNVPEVLAMAHSLRQGSLAETSRISDTSVSNDLAWARAWMALICPGVN
jgi:GNAT superfamily N-acetyltransferase